MLHARQLINLFTFKIFKSTIRDSPEHVLQTLFQGEIIKSKDFPGIGQNKKIDFFKMLAFYAGYALQARDGKVPWPFTERHAAVNLNGVI